MKHKVSRWKETQESVEKIEKVKLPLPDAAPRGAVGDCARLYYTVVFHWNRRATGKWMESKVGKSWGYHRPAASEQPLTWRSCRKWRTSQHYTWLWSNSQQTRRRKFKSNGSNSTSSTDPGCATTIINASTCTDSITAATSTTGAGTWSRKATCTDTKGSG